MSDDASTTKCRVLFTAPWELESKRRGDALGLRALADEFAEAVAPGLTNRVNDGRWVTILAWCLVKSQGVFEADYGKSVTTAAEQRKRYEWLRPLELMWVARTLAITDGDANNRALSGLRSVSPWYKKYKENRRLDGDQFGMKTAQFGAYRQTGMYGGYRVAFRMWPGLTKGGDGWTPAIMAIKLAKLLNRRLGKAGLPTYEAEQRKPTLRASAWWLKHWNQFKDKPPRNDADAKTLPRPRDKFKKLPDDEADILREVIFGGNGNSDSSTDQGCQRRRMIAEAIPLSPMSHLEVCKQLASKFSKEDGVIADLARFSRLADAGMDAMNLIAESLKSDTTSATKSLNEVASSRKAATVCKELHQAALAWCHAVANEPPATGFVHRDKATEFARKIQSADPKECLKALLQHHKSNGGGLLWFVLCGGQIEPQSLPKNNVASSYRFRLWSLCRVAVQCGVIRIMPPGVREEFEESDDDGE